MATITFDNVCKQYGKDSNYAVDKFSMEIQDKEFIILVGPSGCGKSTLLRMVAGLENITSGTITVNDKKINDVEPKNRGIAMVFQNYALYPHMSVYDNLAFGLKLRKMPKKEIKRRIIEVSKILDISEFLKRKPKALSGGQRQRVALGRAIVREPQLFLLDEPLSNLDAKLRSQMRSEIIKLHKKLETTFIYVTHDQIEAMTMGDRIVVMNEGVIQQIGTPYEIFNNPVNMFVAGFIGTPQINFISNAKLSIQDDRYCVEALGCKYNLPKRKYHNVDISKVFGQGVSIGIRPHNIRIVKEPGIECEFSYYEMLGDEIYVYLKTSDNNELIAALPVEQLHEITENKNKNNKIYIDFDESKLFLFDSKTELRIE